MTNVLQSSVLNASCSHRLLVVLHVGCNWGYVWTVVDGKWQQPLFEIVNAVITFRDLDIENSFLDLILGLTWSAGPMYHQYARCCDWNCHCEVIGWMPVVELRKNGLKIRTNVMLYCAWYIIAVVLSSQCVIVSFKEVT